MEQSLTIVLPTRNAARLLAATIHNLRGQCHEMIITDGGSQDGTIQLALESGARLVAGPPGRGVQLATGAAAARTPWLLFLHADTRLGPGWQAAIAAHMAAPANRHRAAYFRFALDDPSRQARRLERAVAWRCRFLALPYGDQGLLISRALYDEVGGFRPLPLMEDVDLIRRLGRRRLVALPVAAVTSAARWQREGWWRRSARNLCCLGLWFLGVPPRRIRRLYG
uniref:TIGR04283 family arsenosugar biosynthesis glycosyltransferase n=1 Tax=Siccirubricoccus phaeus TaxID=2595053 RepID=UPI0011F0F38D